MNLDFSKQHNDDWAEGCAPSSLKLPPPFCKGGPNILMELQHLQDIYQAESILTNCTPALGPLPCYRVELSTHTALPGAPSTIQPQLCPVFPPFPASLPPCIPVWIREWRLFHKASAERQSISYIWWISPDWDKLGSRTKRYASALPPAPAPFLPYPTLQPPLPHPAGERFTQQFSSRNTALHLFPPSLSLSLTSVYLLLSQRRYLSEGRELI